MRVRVMVSVVVLADWRIAAVVAEVTELVGQVAAVVVARNELVHVAAVVNDLEVGHAACSLAEEVVVAAAEGIPEA